MHSRSRLGPAGTQQILNLSTVSLHSVQAGSGKGEERQAGGVGLGWLGLELGGQVWQGPLPPPLLLGSTLTRLPELGATCIFLPELSDHRAWALEAP